MLLLIPNDPIRILARFALFFFVLTLTVQSQTPADKVDELEAIIKRLQGQANDVKIIVKPNSEPSPLGDEAIANFTVIIEEVSKNPNKANKILESMDFGRIRAPKEEVVDDWFKSKVTVGIPPMCGTLAGIWLGQLGVSNQYQTLADYEFQSEMKVTIRIPRNTIYDRASIPRVLSVLITKDELGAVAPLIHDYLYRHGGVLRQSDVFQYRLFSRSEADDIFLEAMRKCGVPRTKRNLAWAAVRVGGAFAWKSPSQSP